MTKVKRFIKWLRRYRPQSIASEVAQGEATDRIEDSDPGKDTPIQDRCDDEYSVPLSTLKLLADPLSDAAEDIGVDPYNTATFDSENK